MKKIETWGLLFSVGALLSGCTSSVPQQAVNGKSYVYHGIDFGVNRNKSFRQGVMDACRTADGEYTKDHERFNREVSYKNGWEDGHLKCRGKL